jgi:hypothetical protein
VPGGAGKVRVKTLHFEHAYVHEVEHAAERVVRYQYRPVLKRCPVG